MRASRVGWGGLVETEDAMMCARRGYSETEKKMANWNPKTSLKSRFKFLTS